jgi:hypothetical protein
MAKNDFDGQEHQAAPGERIKVENEDFVNAVAGDRYNCALVWAIRRQFPDALRVSVNTDHVAFSIDETRYVYPTTEHIVETVIKPLDQGGECKPVTVTLSNGVTKPVRHVDTQEQIQARRANNRNRFSKRAHNEMPPPQASSYKRLMVVKADV